MLNEVKDIATPVARCWKVRRGSDDGKEDARYCEAQLVLSVLMY